MKLSTRSTYGLRAMMILAMEYGQGSILLRDIAERQMLPTTYLEQIMVPLRKAGLVTAMRGINGGYRLTRDPADITLVDVINILDGPLEFVDCTTVTRCPFQQQHCALKSVLQEAETLFITHLRGVSLAELAARQQRSDATAALLATV